jgi:hypothetical protein
MAVEKSRAVGTLLWNTHAMLIGERIRVIREAKGLSLDDIKDR